MLIKKSSQNEIYDATIRGRDLVLHKYFLLMNFCNAREPNSLLFAMFASFGSSSYHMVYLFAVIDIRCQERKG